MTNETKTKKEILENEAITWEDNYYKCYGNMPNYEDTPKKYRKVLWSEY